MPIGTIDWVGLNEALQDNSAQFQEINPTNQIDFDGLNRELEYGLVEKLDYDEASRTRIDVGVTEGDTPWYETAFSDAPNWIANRVIDSWYAMMAIPTLGASLIPLKDRMEADWADGDTDVQTELAKKRQAEFLEGDFAPEVIDFITGDLPKGIEMGAVQFVELVMGGKAETIQDKIEKLEIAGLVKEFQDGNTTKEDFNKEIAWYQERAENIPLARDIVAGITNSLFIMGSLAATGGIARFSTTGLKIGSRAWMKAWGKGMLAQGKNTWNLMKYGATVGALNEAVQEERLAHAKGEEFTFWDWMAEIGRNQVTKHTQAYLEGVSEGVLLGMPMGGVNMTKWISKPIKRYVKVAGKRTEIIESLGTNKIRKLLNSANNPIWQKYYAKALRETIAERKTIAKQLAKNFGRKMINGLFVETFTEQLTDVASDIMEGSHGSAIWLAFGDDKQKAEALRNLIVEASVGVFLGTGVGISDTWKRNIIQEVEEKYGKEVARELDLHITGEKERDLIKKLKKAAKDPNVHDKEAREEANKDLAVQEQGSGKKIPLVETKDDEETMEYVKSTNAQIIAQVLEDVEELPDVNILDYTFRQGKLEVEKYLNLIGTKDSKEGDPVSYELDSYMINSSINGTHDMNEKVHKALVQVSIERGLLENVQSFVDKKQAALAKDLAVGILMSFDQEGWNYVKRKWKDQENIDFAISQAEQLKLSDAELKANKKFEKIKGKSSVKAAQQVARRKYKEVIGDYIAILQQGSAGEMFIEEVEDEEFFEGEARALDVTIEEITDENVIPDDEFHQEFQDAPVGIEAKAKALAGLTGVNFKNVVTLADVTFAVFVEPTSGISFTVDGTELAYDAMHKQALRLKHGMKMDVVAFKHLDGEVILGNRGETHDIATVRLDQEGQFEIEGDEVGWTAGFADKAGNFYTRAEAQVATGLLGESFAQGIATKELQLQDSPIKTGKTSNYSLVTDGFTGNTVSEFIEHLTKQGSVSPVSVGVVEALISYVGDKQLVIDDTLKPGNPGATAFPNETIHINPNATLWHNGSVFDTLAHEMTHAYLHEFMQSGTNAASTFNGKIRGIRNLVKKVISAKEGNALFETRWLGTYIELRTWYKNHEAFIKKALTSDEEFIASVFSDTQFIKYITDNISVGGPKNRLTGWRKIINTIKAQLNIIGVTKLATEEMFNIMERSHNQIIKFRLGKNMNFSARLAKEQKRLGKNITSGYETHERNDDDEADDQSDPMQEWDELEDEGENQLEKADIENFIRTMAPVWGLTEPEYRDHLKMLDSFSSYMEEFNELDEKNSFVLTQKIEHLYKGYHKTFKTVDEFKEAFLTRKYLNVVKKNAKPTFIMMGMKDLDPITGKMEYRYEMRKVKGVYRDGNGKQRNTYRRDTVLEGFIPELEKKLALPAGTLGISYIDGFESYKNGKIQKRTNLSRLDKYMLGKRKDDKLPLTQNLANMIWDAQGSGATMEGMMYIGNFAGKNTLPILTYNLHDEKVIFDALDRYTKGFNQSALEEFGMDYSANPRTYKRPQQYGSTTRALLEDLWFKREDGQSAREDWNKMMKRSPKWNAEDTGVLIDADRFEKQFGNAAVNGIRMDGNDLLINAAVVASTDDQNIRLKGFDNVEREIPLSQLFINELATSTIDGASFFIIGHFDKAYSLAHGTLKSGAIKNVYSSRVGEDPLFLKHAMHGVAKDSPLGKLMIANNVAVLISDEAMKEGPQEKIIGAAELQDPTMFTQAGANIELKMSQFSRHSESQYSNLMSGATKQLGNGTAFSELYNEILKSISGSTSINDILKNLSDNVARQTTDWFRKHSTPEAMHQMLREIVYNPKSPQEEKVSQIWIDFIEPLEGQTDENVRKKYIGAWQHAHTAEVLRARMQFKLNEMLAGKIPGARAVLQPNVGWANDVNDIKPITSNYNLANILVSGMKIPADVMKAAFPESGLLTEVRMLQELQKQEQRAHNLEDKDVKKQQLKNIAEGRAVTITKIRELQSERLEDIVTSKTATLSPHSLVNWADKAVQDWKDEVVFGTWRLNDEKVMVRQKNGILDEETGRLRQGWAILTEDQADELGIKPGDWVIGVITPTDSPLGVIGVRVASILKSNDSKKDKGRKTADNSKAMFNSEWLQTMAGKDFDIDTISILTFDERYWSREDFEKLAEISSKIPAAYSQKVAEETIKLFEEKGFVPKDELGNEITVTKDNVFKEDIIREAYSILMNGVPKGKGKRRRFSIMGDSFMELDNAYLHDPAPIINERLHHTAASALNMRAGGVLVPYINNKGSIVTQFSRKGEVSDIKVDFSVRNKDWLRLHINHLHMTNAEVDFPNKTTRLAYLSDSTDPAYKRIMGMYFWGLGSAQDYKHIVNQTKEADESLKLNSLEHIFDALKSFQKMLFDDSFQLARGRNAMTFEKLDYFDTAQQIKRAQGILKALQSGDKEAILALVNTWIKQQEKARNRAAFPESKFYKQMTRRINQQAMFLRSFAEKLKIDNVYDYPLFNSIKNINLAELLDFMPGNIYKDHLINQVLASLETISYYPDLKEVYDDQIKHINNIAQKTSAEGNPFKVSERVARKPAQIILGILGLPVGDQRKAVGEVRYMLNQKKQWDDRITKLPTAADKVDLMDALDDFLVLEKRIGKAFEPFERDGSLINVDTEVITMTRMLQSLDALEERMSRNPNQSPQAYWRKQLRGFRYEVNQILHAFDEREPLKVGRRLARPGEKIDKRKHISQVMEMQRAAQSATYPILMKSILNTQFLQFSDSQTRVKMKFSGEDIIFSTDGAGQLILTWRGKSWNHNEINDQTTDDTIALYKMLTQRSVGDKSGFWEGIEDSRQGTYNRFQLGKLFSFSRNLSMEAREKILEEYLIKHLYEGTRGFTATDQKAFWISMLAQTSDQGIQDKKATGLIVNQSIYDKTHPFKFQSNHIAINLLGLFEPEMQNLWLQLYSVADINRSPEDRANTLAALKDGQDSTLEMLYQDAPVESVEATSRHFFSDYVDEHKKLSKDDGYIKFYKYTRDHTWDESLEKLRDLGKGTLMLKALSENGVFYEDLIRDLKILNNKEFFNKYKQADLTAIRHAIERYTTLDTLGGFIRQRAGESDVAFRTRSNLLVLYYQVNGAKKREGARNSKLTFIRKMLSNVIGYDMHALLREKKTHIFDHKEEEVGFSWTEDGVRSFTVGDAIIAMKTHATRTFQGIGESIIAITKSQRVNRTLATHQVTLNNQANHFEDIAKLMSNLGFRDSWRVQFEHKKMDKRTPHNDRTRFIVDLLQEIPSGSVQQLEIRRRQIFSIAENMKDNRHTYAVRDGSGNIVYKMELGGKQYSYTSIRELIDAHFSNLSPSQKLALVGAFDIREMYDIHVPEILQQMVDYLGFTRDHLADTLNIDSSLKVDAMMDKYQGMLDLIKAAHGNYMPHQFSIARYRDAWMKGYLDASVKELERRIQYHKKNKHNIYLAQLDLVKDKVKIREMAYANATKVWDSISHDWGSGALIPNFMPRTMPDATGYTKTDPTIHFNYITKLIKGLKNDSLYSDWLIYQANARAAGERHSTMEITRRWYGDQIGDHTLRSKGQKWSDIKAGQEIHFNRQSFIIEPTNDVGYYGNITVSGVVRKVTDDEVFLNVDTESIAWQARMALKKWTDREARLIMEGVGHEGVPTKMYATLQNMIKKQVLGRNDFITFDMSKLTQLGAIELIILGTKRIIKDPRMIGRYKRTEVWGEDIMGVVQENTVNVYHGQGAVERLRAKRDALKNLDLMGDDYEGKMPHAKYKMFQYAHGIVNGVFGAFKKISGLFYMGLASAGPARFTNQFGAIVNNLIDSPIYNYQRWKEGNDLWSKIKHGQLDMMEESEKRIYKTVVGLGLTDSNNILAIALEAANIKPEDMLVEGSKVETIKWLARLFRDATNYDATYKRLEKLSHAFNMESDPIKRTDIQGQIHDIKSRWQAKMHKLLSDPAPVSGERTPEQIETNRAMWKKANELAKSDPKINIAEEQGFTQAMAIKLFAKVAWKGFFTSNLGMGFQAKAEKMRIPAFFIGYTTAIRMGFDGEEALQLAVNSVELRHAFYGAANKQFGANTKIGSVGFQYAQYQYNAISKAVRIMREAIPQMIGFAHNKPEGVSNLKHAWKLLGLIQNTVDEKGKQLMKPGSKVPLKEINLMHGILLKIAWTGVMMNVGTRLFYGLTNIQDPVGQMVYRQMDYLMDIMAGGVDFDDEGDMDELAYAIQDMALPLGLLYKLGIQSVTSVPVKGFDKTYFVGRVDNTFDFSWRLVNTINTAAYQLGVSDEKPNEDNEILFDLPWIVDDFTTGVKLQGWTSGDNIQSSYKKRGLYYGIDSDLIPYMTVETRRKKTFAGGRFVDTDKKGMSGFGKGGSNIRALYLLDPLTYIPFLDRLTGGKTIYKTLRGK